ncbi:hypothetical protein BCD64_21435 [Nostoc sp. MBR 210]|nr:hypothetical protein BCD64_21435 [Nostoc sp. MBR 210]
MSYDNLCKLLSEKYPDSFATWVMGGEQTSAEVLKTELSIEPIRADYVTFMRLQGRILHLEFQTKIESEPPLPLRMLDYWVRLYRLYRLPITQVVVLLLPPAAGTIIETCFELESTRHEYQVIKMWEQDPTELLKDIALLPLAPLAATTKPEALLQKVAQRVTQLEPEQRREVSGYVQILAGLKFEKNLIQQMFREGMMRESVIYQEILQEGLQEGRLEEARSLILRLLTRQIGDLPQTMRSQFDELSVNELEALGEALLDFRQLTDLEFWLLNR